MAFSYYVKNEVMLLISQKKEGEFWDFKREWHSNNSDLLHDIICMANNITKRDGLIVIGVDEENDFDFVDISRDVNRKNSQQLIDFLKDKPFAGGIRPTVSVEEINLGDRTIDVILVKNDINAPYYLEKNYCGVLSYHIYTRVGDTNTPKDKSADIDFVEKLWKKHFQIDLTPLETVTELLKDHRNWDQSGIQELVEFNKTNPEYTIEIIEDKEKDDYAFYLFSQTDYYPDWAKIILRYHQTILRVYDGTWLDGRRHFTPVPYIHGFSLSPYSLNWDITFDYFIEDSLEYIIHWFYHDIYSYDEEKAKIRNKFMETILVFKEKRDIEPFIDYAMEKWSEINKDQYKSRIPFIPKIKGLVTEYFAEKYLNGLVLKDLLSAYYRDKDKLL